MKTKTKKRAPADQCGAKPRALEFFAGAGMARLGLGENWRCVFANDVDPMKCAVYRKNFGTDELIERSIAKLAATDLPTERADLAWASFPCQDLSLAGARGGLGAARSGLFFEFWRLMKGLSASGRAPRAIVIENVVGLLTSNGGADFIAIITRLIEGGYSAGALVVDAASFAPQSRPRLFIIGLGADPRFLEESEAPDAQIEALKMRLPAHLSRFWFQPPRPRTQRNLDLIDIVDRTPPWDPPEKTDRLIAMMSPLQRRRLDAIRAEGAPRVGAGFRRTRTNNGVREQRFEARFDGLAGCVRTPAGGSSRQYIIGVDEGVARTRLMTSREAARAMGLPDEFQLPAGANAGLKICGDGVCPPAVRWIASNILEPALGAARRAA